MHSLFTRFSLSVFARQLVERFAGPGDPPPVRSNAELWAHLSLQAAALLLFALVVR